MASLARVPSRDHPGLLTAADTVTRFLRQRHPWIPALLKKEKEKCQRKLRTPLNATEHCGMEYCLATVLSTKSMDRVRTDDFWPEMHSSDPSEVRVR